MDDSQTIISLLKGILELNIIKVNNSIHLNSEERKLIRDMEEELL